MPHSRHTSRSLLRAILALSLTVAACGEQAIHDPVATAPPSERASSDDDPRIGDGLPAEVRFAGTEHNRLTVAVLRANRHRQHQFSDPAARCAGILSAMNREAGRTAATAGIPGAEGQLRAILRSILARNPGCPSAVSPPSTKALAGDARVTAEVDPDSVISDAAFIALDRLHERILASSSESEVLDALNDAAAATAGMRALDALAVQAAIAQSQGSVVLWAPGGAGWTELDPGTQQQPQSLFRLTAVQEAHTVEGFIGAVGADFGGCMGAVRFLRDLFTARDPRLLIAGCSFGAAGATVWYGYKLYHPK